MRTNPVFGGGYASVYDCLYGSKDYSAECDFLETLWASTGNKIETVLDIGCGTGGHSIELARRGYRMVGVDLSPQMLHIAEKKAKAEQLDIEFLQGDARSFELGKRFDAVISMFAVISYQLDNASIAKAILNANKHLKPGGIFIFDVWHGSAVLYEKPMPRFKKLEVDGRQIMRFTESSLDAAAQCVNVDFTVVDCRDGESASTIFERHRVRYMFPLEISYFCENAFFSDISICPFGVPGAVATEKDWSISVTGRSQGVQ